MKMKFIRNGRTQRRELIVASQRGELLDTKRAGQLADDLSTMLLLGYSYEMQRGGSGSLQHYDVEGLWSLKTYLSKRAMNEGELAGLLQAVQQVLEVCAQKRFPAEGLLFDPEYVFVDAACRPHFALVLLEGMPFRERNSPLALLRAIGDGEHLRFASPDAEGLARHVGEFVENQDGVYSANNYRRFLESEGLGESAADGRQGSAEAGGSSVWASAGTVTGTGATDGGSFFWSPLSGLVDRPVEEEPKQAAAPAPAAAPFVAPTMPAAAAAAAAVPPVALAAPAVAPAPPVALAAPAASTMPAPAAPAPAAEAAPAPSVVAASTPRPASAPAEASRAWLMRPTTGEEFALPLGRQVRVGRGSACDIRLLGNRKLSRVHAGLTFTGQTVMVSDLGAANGIFIDGERLMAQQSVLMTANQHLRLADEELGIRVE